MNTTLFLAQIYGPILVAVSLGIFLSRNYYTRIYSELEKDSLAVLVFGIAMMAGGITHLMIHNSWSTLPQIVISIIGWGMLLKGIIFVVYPGLADRSGDYWVNHKLISIAGWATLIIGTYISWISYFA